MADFFGGLVSYGANRIAQERSFEMQKELQGDAQNYNTLMWNKANEYNSPYQQMMRFQSAGLNPNLIYSQMNGGLAAPTMGSGSAPSPAQSPGISMLESAQIGLMKAQKDNIEADTYNKMTEGDLNTSNIALNQTHEELNNSMKALNEAQTKKVNEEIPLIRAEVNRTFQEYLKLKVDTSRLNEFYDSQIKKLEAEAGLATAEANDIINTYKERVNLLIAQANRENWTSKQLEKQVELLGEEYVQATYATKIAEATTAVEGNKGYQWLSKSIGLLSDAVGSVGGIMLGVGALKGAGAAASRAATESQRVKLFGENAGKGVTTGFRPKY